MPAALPAAPWSKLDADGAQLVRLYPADSIARALWVAPAGVEPPAGPALDGAAWDWLDVVAGVPLLSQPVVEAFVPQMVNMESVGGVNFKKGCYPGQEVVARSQFRGTLKRRAYLAHASAEVAVGAEIFAASDLSQPCGLVVQAAPAPAGGVDAIVSLQIASADQALQVGGTPEGGGVALALQPLPYELLADI